METTQTTATGTDGAASAPPLTAIHHVGITVTDVEASEAWYGRVLGLTRVFVEPHHQSDAGGYAVILGADGLNLNLGLDHHPGNDKAAFDETRTGLDHVCFLVSTRVELDAWAAHLDGLGVAHSGVTEVEGTPYAVVNFRDPDGIALELMSAG